MCNDKKSEQKLTFDGAEFDEEEKKLEIPRGHLQSNEPSRSAQTAGSTQLCVPYFQIEFATWFLFLERYNQICRQYLTRFC